MAGIAKPSPDTLTSPTSTTRQPSRSWPDNSSSDLHPLATLTYFLSSFLSSRAMRGKCRASRGTPRSCTASLTCAAFHHESSDASREFLLPGLQPCGDLSAPISHLSPSRCTPRTAP